MGSNKLQVASRESFYSLYGNLVEFDSDRWTLSKDVTIPVGNLCSMFPGDGTVLRRVVESYAKRSSPSHARNLTERFSHYLKNLGDAEVFSVPSMISYRALLGKKREWYVGSLRVFIYQWHRLGYEGISEECLALLDKWVIKGNEKGFAVQSMCPEDGPLTDIEMLGVVDAVSESFASKALSVEQTAIALVVSMTGRRPIQITALKIKDLMSPKPGEYWINFPRGKRRGGIWRSEFKKFPIVEDLWMVLQAQADLVKSTISAAVSPSVFKAVDYREFPVFPNYNMIGAATSVSDFVDTDMLHLPGQAIYQVMKDVSSVVNVVSERHGLPMKLNPNRFRYTLGTNLAREGRGISVIAEALDHSDTQNAGVYVRNTPDIVGRIDKAVALQLAPFAQAFRGVLVTSENEAVRGSDPTSRISSVDGRKRVGTCGSYGWCGAMAPLVCYTCIHFQPWLDGPHEEVLDGLLAERDQVLVTTGDMKIASVNDRLILAVSQVVADCKTKKGSE